MAALLLFQQSGFSSPAKRIVSLDLCTDWMLIKYASPSQVLAYSPRLYRFRSAWVPDGLPTHDGTLEHILSLVPDLVITGEYNALTLRQRLKQLGYNVQIMPLPTDLQTIQSYQSLFDSVVKGQNTSNRAPPRAYAAKHKSLLLLGANGIGTGRGTLEHDVIHYAGWSNYVQQQGYVNLNLEQLVSNPPDAVLWSAPKSQSLANLFAQHPVLKRLVDQSGWLQSDYWRWQCPGPWTFELIKELGEWQNF